MSGAVKHEQRSHKTRNKNYSEFRRFSIKAIRTSEQKSTRKTARKSFGERLKSLFTRKHQGR